MSISKRSYPYLAGLIDGDGGIYICKSKVLRHDTYQAHLCVANSDMRIMKWLQHHFGGCIHKNSSKGSNPNFGSVIRKQYANRDDNWQWRLTGNKAVDRVLTEIRPYLLINGQRAAAVHDLTKLHGKYRATAEREDCFQRYTNAKPQFELTTTATDAYFAGMFDAEGSISIAKNARPENFRVLLRISNNNRDLVTWLQANFPAAVYVSPQAGEDRYTWYYKETNEQKLERFILGILPYVVIKKEPVQLALNMIRIPSTERTLEQVNKVRDQIIELNHSYSSLETNTPACPESGQKIESRLFSDGESAPLVTATA